MFDSYVKMILRAPVYDVARETPLEIAPAITRRIGNQVWLKREDMQSVFSYKIRGAYNLMASFSREELSNGVITANFFIDELAFNPASSSMKKFAVLPVPTPIMESSSTNSIAACAAERFFSSWELISIQSA